MLIGVPHHIRLNIILNTCLSSVNSPFISFILFSVALKTIFKAYLPASMVADDTSQVYLGAPMINTLT